MKTSSSSLKRWRYPQGTCLSIYPNHLACNCQLFRDTSGDTLFRNPVQRFAPACISQLAATLTKERVSVSGCITVQAGAMWKKRTQNPVPRSRLPATATAPLRPRCSLALRSFLFWKVVRVSTAACGFVHRHPLAKKPAQNLAASRHVTVRTFVRTLRQSWLRLVSPILA